MDSYTAQVRQRLDFIWLELTGRCNLRCTHCYADSGPDEPLEDGMHLDDWLRALDEAAALGCRRVQFIGGEPTLHPGLARLIEHARVIGYDYVAVYTNGTHITEALKKVFLAQRVSLAFSIYGTEASIHDQVTLRRGSFARTSVGLRWAIDSGLPVSANIIEMDVNADGVPETERRLREMGVRNVHTDRLRGLGRGADERPAQPRLRELCGRCGDRKVCISSTGAIFPCVFARFASLGNLKSDGIAGAFNSLRLTDFRDALVASHPWLAARRAASMRSMPATDGMACGPETDPGPCDPERPSTCGPETDPGPCDPEKPTTCGPETDPGPCDPEKPVPDCVPERPSSCRPEDTA